MGYEIRVEKVDNGYIVTRPHPCEDTMLTEVFEIQEAYSDTSGRTEECKALSSVLWTLINEFCPHSKHSPVNLRAMIVETDEDGNEHERDLAF